MNAALSDVRGGAEARDGLNTGSGGMGRPGEECGVWSDEGGEADGAVKSMMLLKRAFKSPGSDMSKMVACEVDNEKQSNKPGNNKRRSASFAVPVVLATVLEGLAAGE